MLFRSAHQRGTRPRQRNLDARVERRAVVHQREALAELHDLEATVVGFRFPRDAAGLELPGWHLHLVSADRTAGGHVLDLSLDHGTIRVEHESELVVEVPAGVDVGHAGADAARDAALDDFER